MSVSIRKYRKEYIVKSYEADCHGNLRLLSLMNYLQEAAVEHAEELGLGFGKCQELDLAWVGSNYLLEISRFPRIDERIIVETWPAEAKLWGAIRDFIIKDESGESIVKAISQWVLIDAKRRRPVMLKKHFPEYMVLTERVLNREFGSAPELPENSTKYVYKVRFDDIDVNNHVNNAVYPLWASESVDSDFRISHVPHELEIGFKHEALFGGEVAVDTFMSESKSEHIVYDNDNGNELAWCRILWREFTSK